jgi:surfeit locus 1 family protein
MRISFRLRAIPFVVTVLLVALGVALGQWQDRRAAYKSALQDKLTVRGADAPVALGAALAAAEPLEYRHVTVTGEFVREWPLFLDNRPHEGKAGFYLVMPLRIKGSDTHVLVARGWLPRHTAEYGRLPAYTTPAGTVTIDGIVKTSVGHIMQLGTPSSIKPNAIVQNIDVGQFAHASKMKLQPFFIEQGVPAAPADTLERAWPAPSLGVEKHQGYAFQWYALAVMALLFFVITGFRRGTTQND